MSTSHSMGVLGMGTYGVSMPFTPPPIHGFHLTPRIRRAMGLANKHVNHLETAATLIPRHHHQHRNLCCGQLLRQQNPHQGDLENCLVLFTHIDRAARTTETVHVLQQTLRPGGGGLLGKKASVPRVFYLISFILLSVWTAADRRAVFRDHWVWWQSRVWAGPGMASRAPS